MTSLIPTIAVARNQIARALAHYYNRPVSNNRTIAGFRGVRPAAGDVRVRPSLMFTFDYNHRGNVDVHYVCIHLTRNTAATTEPSLAAYRTRAIQNREATISTQLEGGIMHLVYFNIGEFPRSNDLLGTRIQHLIAYIDRTIMNNVPHHDTVGGTYFAQ